MIKLEAATRLLAAESQIFVASVEYESGGTDTVLVSAPDKKQARAYIKQRFDEANTVAKIKSLVKITREQADKYWNAIDWT